MYSVLYPNYQTTQERHWHTLWAVIQMRCCGWNRNLKERKQEEGLDRKKHSRRKNGTNLE